MDDVWHIPKDFIVRAIARPGYVCGQTDLSEPIIIFKKAFYENK